jgi:hypothetical protein
MKRSKRTKNITLPTFEKVGNGYKKGVNAMSSRKEEIKFMLFLFYKNTKKNKLIMEKTEKTIYVLKVRTYIDGAWKPDYVGIFSSVEAAGAAATKAGYYDIAGIKVTIVPAVINTLKSF